MANTNGKSPIRQVIDHAWLTSVLIGIAALIGGIISLATHKPIAIRVFEIDITSVTPTDLPLVLALIVLDLNLVEFYACIVGKVDSTVGEEVFSLVGVVYMIALNLLVLIPQLFALRIALISVLLLLTWLKNRLLKRKLATEPVGRRFVEWTANARWAFWLSIAVSCAFFCLLSESTRMHVLRFFVTGDHLGFTPAYSFVVQEVTYSTLLVLVCIAYFRNAQYFRSADFKSFQL